MLTIQANAATTTLTNAAPAASPGWRLSYKQLAGRLTDLARLALLPIAGERGELASSHSRESRYDERRDRYVDWFHNSFGGGIGDGTGIVGVNAVTGEVVMADIEGPGVIWRIWSAAPSDNQVRFYIDEASQPAIALPFSVLFDPAKGPFKFDELVYEAGRGRNCYVPIPFQHSCRIVTDTQGFGRYFHFGYTRFPASTRLQAFRLALGQSEAAPLAQAKEVLARRGESPYPAATGTVTDRRRVVAGVGRVIRAFDCTGSGAITELRIKLARSDPGDWTVLRELTLSIYWDDEEKPSVWSPLGDFFGTAPGMNNYRSLPMGVTLDGCYSFWCMPFSTRARIEIANDGPNDVALEMVITRRPLELPAAQYARFHAKWHRDAFPPRHPDRKPIDWTVLTTQGRGRYCGMMLHVWNPAGGWWGEGDEKFFVDGEKFPSTFGTGTEDYFGYAWRDPSLFNRAYHSQTFNSRDPAAKSGRPDWKAESFKHASVNRWHIADDVPFQSSFEASLEKYLPNDRSTIYACVAYWYLASDGVDPYGAVPLAERLGYLHPPASPSSGRAMPASGRNDRTATGGSGIVQRNMGSVPHGPLGVAVFDH